MRIESTDKSEMYYQTNEGIEGINIDCIIGLRSVCLGRGLRSIDCIIVHLSVDYKLNRGVYEDYQPIDPSGKILWKAQLLVMPSTIKHDS